MSWLSVALLACAVVAVIGAEWPRLGERLGLEARRKRERAKRKSQLKLLRTESDDFAASGVVSRRVFGSVALASSVFFVSW